jgi:hypothetical protein
VTDRDSNEFGHSRGAILFFVSISNRLVIFGWLGRILPGLIMCAWSVSCGTGHHRAVDENASAQGTAGIVDAAPIRADAGSTEASAVPSTGDSGLQATPTQAPPEPRALCSPPSAWDGKACVPDPCPLAQRVQPDGMPLLNLGPCIPEHAGNPADPPFNRSVAADSLSKVSLTPCVRQNGPTGGGHALITFLPTGEVGDVVIDQPPFAGTLVGRCIAARFRDARVPSFRGTPVSLGRSFLLR